jgi:hypothetical protein
VDAEQVEAAVFPVIMRWVDDPQFRIAARRSVRE